MTKLSTLTHQDKDAGFTLVELAVVMIIIGLLIGGVLKGQELINNAEVTNSAGAIQTYDSASLSFSDAFGTYPGDVQNPADRIPDCAGTCVPAGSTLGNRQIADGNGFGGAGQAERNASFLQLYLADFIGGMDPNQLAVPGGEYPGLQVEDSVGMTMAYTDDGAAADFPGIIADPATTTPRRGHYFGISLDPTVDFVAGNGTLEVNDAARLDQKLDDGNPNTGDVLAYGAVGDCASADDETGVYRTADDGALCGLYIATSF